MPPRLAVNSIRRATPARCTAAARRRRKPTIRRGKVKVATRLKEPTRLKDMVVTRHTARREAIRRKDRREAIRLREVIRLKAREVIRSKDSREATRLKAIRRAATRRSP